VTGQCGSKIGREGERGRGRGDEGERGRGEEGERKGVARRAGSQCDHICVTPGPHEVPPLCEPAFLTRSSLFCLNIRRQMEKVSCLLMAPPAKRRMARRADAASNATNASNGTLPTGFCVQVVS